MSFDFDSLLSNDISLDAFNKPTRSDDLVYKPKAQDGKDNVYKAVIRFIPWYKNPKQSIIEKWTGWLEDPSTGKGRFVDCPSSIGQQSPLLNMWRKLKDSENPYEREMSKIFSRRLNCYSLVQIIKDSSNPELEGKIRVFKFGKKLKDKIEAELNPEIGEPKDPFNLLKGRRFVLHITRQGDWDNYDNSKFDGEAYPIISTQDGQIDLREAMIDPNLKSTIAEWLEKNSPNLDDFAFKPWDDDMINYVNNVIKSVTNSSGHAISDVDDLVSSASSLGQKKVVSVSDIDDIILDVPSSVKKKPMQKSKQIEEEVTIDSLNLDIYGED